MPFREKSAWIALLTTSAVYAVFFLRAALTFQPGLFAAGVMALIVLQIALHVVAAAMAPRDAAAKIDERERLIELRALRIAFYVAQAGIFCALSALVWRSDAAFVANMLLAVMVAAELARAGATVVLFRRAAA